MKYWDNMSEEEKSEVCRNSGCPYFFGEIDDCMCDEVERSPYDAEEKACHWLKKHGEEYGFKARKKKNGN
jgi:hypothetical protein